MTTARTRGHPGAPLVHTDKYRGGMPSGWTDLTRMDDPAGVGIGLALVRVRPGEALDVPARRHQAAWLLLGGTGHLSVAGRRILLRRSDLFGDLPHTLLVPSGNAVRLEAASAGLELVQATVAGRGASTPVEVPPADVRVEERGRGQLGGTYHRQVRTVADRANASRWGLVIGEVVARPGAWSSYPPHHHPQPEIYYYRFDRPGGYGHAEVGERVFKVRDHDLTLMRAGEDHAQVCAPGYRMWYLWVIRHLPRRPYVRPEFTHEHRWLLDARVMPRRAGRAGARMV